MPTPTEPAPDPAGDPPRAVIDIGTNTVLMLVARRRPDGSVEVREDRSKIARLGEGAGASGQLTDAAITRALDALRDQVAHARGLGVRDIQAVATAGVRMAKNRDAFLQPAATVLGAPVRVLSGDEEARLSYLSVAREEPPAPLRVLDIGGGSTELVAGEGDEIASARSHPMGSVRYTERFVRADPPGLDAARAVEAAAREQLASQPLAPHDTLHALAGTATSTAALLLDLQDYDHARVDGSSFATDQVRALRDRLAEQDQATRAAHPCLPPRRADVIVAGISILLAALAHCGAHTLVVRDRGLRYALI